MPRVAWLCVLMLPVSAQGQLLTVGPGDAAGPQWRYTVTNTRDQSIELFADDRLLSIEATPVGKGRTVRCKTRRAPRKVLPDRVITLAPGQQHTGTFDLRQLCWGRGWDVIQHGAVVEGTFGFRRLSKSRWAVRYEKRGRTKRIKRLKSTAQVIRKAATVSQTENDGPLRITLQRQRARSSSGLRFLTRLRSSGSTTRVYLRNDLWRFAVTGPTGEHTCQRERAVVSPIVDFYRRISSKRSVRARLVADAYCDQTVFEKPGLYEVTPFIDLIYDGSRFGLDTHTGTVQGTPTLFWITGG